MAAATTAAARSGFARGRASSKAAWRKAQLTVRGQAGQEQAYLLRCKRQSGDERRQQQAAPPTASCRRGGAAGQGPRTKYNLPVIVGACKPAGATFSCQQLATPGGFESASSPLLAIW